MRSLFVVPLLLCLTVLPARAATWLVVSDIHLNPYDTSATPSVYGADSNWALWSSTLGAMRRDDPHPSVIVVAGDLLAHRFPTLVRDHRSGTAEDAAEATMRRIASSLTQAFAGVPILVTLGNNDDPCGDYGVLATSPYHRALASIWRRPVTEGGYYTAQIPGHERAIVLDDVYWSIFAHACRGSSGHPAHDELTWLRGALAVPPGTRAVLVEHVPPGIDAMTTLVAHRFIVVPYLRADVEQELLSELSAAAPHVAFAIAGHAHRSDFRVLGGVATVVAPAVSPIYDNNPAFLRLTLGRDGSLLDYTEYAYDETRGTWGADFDFDRAYRAKRVDATTMIAAHDEIGSYPAVRTMWADALVAGSSHAEIDAANWRTVWCAQTTTGRAFNACARLRRRLLVLPIAGALLGVVIIASVVLIFLRMGRPTR
jgi:hypothetical protein